MPSVIELASLRRMPPFRGLSDVDLASVAERLRRRQYRAGSSVINADAPGDAIFFVVSGTVKIKVDEPDGREVIIAILGLGEVFGELSLIDSAGRSADVVTQEDADLLWVERESFDEIMAEHPSVVRELLVVLTRRVRLSTEQIRALCTLDVYGKVARQLLVFAEQYGEPTDDGVRIPMRLTQTDIAGLVGASRERVNQVVVNLRERGLVAVDSGHRTTVLQPERLREIVSQR